MTFGVEGPMAMIGIVIVLAVGAAFGIERHADFFTSAPRPFSISMIT